MMGLPRSEIDDEGVAIIVHLVMFLYSAALHEVRWLLKI